MLNNVSRRARLVTVSIFFLSAAYRQLCLSFSSTCKCSSFCNNTPIPRPLIQGTTHKAPTSILDIAHRVLLPAVLRHTCFPHQQHSYPLPNLTHPCILEYIVPFGRPLGTYFIPRRRRFCNGLVEEDEFQDRYYKAPNNYDLGLAATFPAFPQHRGLPGQLDMGWGRMDWIPRWIGRLREQSRRVRR
jgi:hypothetical protein